MSGEKLQDCSQGQGAPQRALGRAASVSHQLPVQSPRQGQALPAVTHPAQLSTSLQPRGRERGPQASVKSPHWNLFFLHRFPSVTIFVRYQGLREQQYLVCLSTETEAHVEEVIQGLLF